MCSFRWQYWNFLWNASTNNEGGINQCSLFALAPKLIGYCSNVPRVISKHVYQPHKYGDDRSSFFWHNWPDMLIFAFLKMHVIYSFIIILIKNRHAVRIMNNVSTSEDMRIDYSDTVSQWVSWYVSIVLEEHAHKKVTISEWGRPAG